MIYLLSDIHGDKDFKGLKDYLKIATDEDLLIILGDTGLMYAEREDYREFTEFFLSIDKNIAFIDGNHENFDYLYSFPREDWNGGKIHRLTKNIVHLERGNIFTLQGKTFFVLGGCKSSDKWKELGLWYPQESPTDTEIHFAKENLLKHGCKVDYILTHRYEKTNEDPEALTLEGVRNYIDKNVEFIHWYAGHWHSTQLNRRHSIIYDKLIKIV